MKIKFEDGSEKDTDEMDDLSQAVMEKGDELLKLCFKYKIPIYCKFFNPATKQTGGFHNFNEQGKDFGPVAGPTLDHLSEIMGRKIVVEPRDT